MSLKFNDVFDLKNGYNSGGGGSSPVIESLSITPSTSAQTITAPSGTDGYSPISVSAVTSSIDSNITAENIKDGVTILDVTGNYTGSTPSISSLSVTPTTSAQTITAPSGTDGYSPISVSAVTSSIDNNITAGNIKKDVTILGVTGTYEGSGGSFIGIPREVSAQGVYQMPAASFTFSLPSNATDIGTQGLYYVFQSCTSLTSVDLSSLTTIRGSNGMNSAFRDCTSLTSANVSNLTTINGSYGMSYTFSGCTSLTSVDLSSLITISGNNGLSNTFNGCTSLTSVDLSNLTTISASSGMSNTFQGCTSLTSVDLSSLTAVNGGYGLSNTFYGCTHLTSVDLSNLATVNVSYGMQKIFYYCSGLTSVNLSSLTDISKANVLTSAFQGCTSLTSLSFPALTSTSFGNATNQFSNMLSGVTGCTVHFPSNLQSVMSSWSDVTNGFAGTNTRVSFDLTATT